MKINFKEFLGELDKLLVEKQVVKILGKRLQCIFYSSIVKQAF